MSPNQLLAPGKAQVSLGRCPVRFFGDGEEQTSTGATRAILVLSKDSRQELSHTDQHCRL